MYYSSILSDLCISEINFVNTYVAKPDDYPMKRSGRHHCGFLYTVEGTETYHFHDKSIPAVPNSLLFIPKNENYTITLRGEQSIVKVIDFELVSKTLPRPFCISFRKNNTLSSFFSDAEKLWLKKKPGYDIECKACFYKIAAQAIKHENNHLNSENYAKIATAVDYIHEHYTEPDFRIEKLIDIAKISSKYFETLFAREFNMPPKEYVTMLKIERAKELLAGEKAKVGNVAFELGYSDIYHFSKIFKNKTGHSPREYKYDVIKGEF